MGYNTEDILAERKRREELQKKLMNRFNNPLLFMRINYPGVNNNNNITNGILQKMDALVSDIFSNKVQIRLFRISSEGPNIIMILKDKPIEIKKITIQIEEKHILGSCLDIDVYDNESCKAISRVQLGMEPRPCFICEDIAQSCIKSHRHKEEEVIKFIHRKYEYFMESFYGKKV